MALVIKPFTYTNGTVADANEVNANFDVLFNLLNGNLDGENLANNSIPGSDLIDDSVGFDKLNWGSGENQIDGTETSYWLLSKGSDFEFRMEHEGLSDTRVWSWPDTDDRFVGEDTEQFLNQKTFRDDLRFQSDNGNTAAFQHGNTAERVYRVPNRSGHIPSLPSEATTETGDGAIVRANRPVLNQATLDDSILNDADLRGSPQINNFTSAQHDHGSAREGGPLALNAVRSAHVTQYEDNLRLDAGQITSGTFNNARISSSNVTQHADAIDHHRLRGLADDDHPQYLHLNKANQILNRNLNVARGITIDGVNISEHRHQISQNNLSRLHFNYEIVGSRLFVNGDQNRFYPIARNFASDGTADGWFEFNHVEDGKYLSFLRVGSEIYLQRDGQGTRQFTIAENQSLGNGRHRYRLEGADLSDYTVQNGARFWGTGMQVFAGIVGSEFNGEMNRRYTYRLQIWYELQEDAIVSVSAPRNDGDDIVMSSVVGYQHYDDGFDSNDGYTIGPAIANGNRWDFDIELRNRDDSRLDLEFTIIPANLSRPVG